MARGSVLQKCMRTIILTWYRVIHLSANLVLLNLVLLSIISTFYLTFDQLWPNLGSYTTPIVRKLTTGKNDGLAQLCGNSSYKPLNGCNLTMTH